MTSPNTFDILSPPRRWPKDPPVVVMISPYLAATAVFVSLPQDTPLAIRTTASVASLIGAHYLSEEQKKLSSAFSASCLAAQGLGLSLENRVSPVNCIALQSLTTAAGTMILWYATRHHATPVTPPQDFSPDIRHTSSFGPSPFSAPDSRAASPPVQPSGATSLNVTPDPSAHPSPIPHAPNQ